MPAQPVQDLSLPPIGNGVEYRSDHGDIIIGLHY